MIRSDRGRRRPPGAPPPGRRARHRESRVVRRTGHPSRHAPRAPKERWWPGGWTAPVPIQSRSWQPTIPLVPRARSDLGRGAHGFQRDRDVPVARAGRVGRVAHEERAGRRAAMDPGDRETHGEQAHRAMPAVQGGQGAHEEQPGRVAEVLPAARRGGRPVDRLAGRLDASPGLVKVRAPVRRGAAPPGIPAPSDPAQTDEPVPARQVLTPAVGRRAVDSGRVARHHRGKAPARARAGHANRRDVQEVGAPRPLDPPGTRGLPAPRS